MAIVFIPAVIGAAILAPALAERRRVDIRNATNTTLTLVSPVTAVLPPDSEPLVIEGANAAEQIDGTFAGVPAGIGQEVAGEGSAVVDDSNGEGALDIKQAAHRLTASDGETKWGMLVQARNTSGLWAHEAIESPLPADVTALAGAIQLDRGVKSAQRTSASIAVVTDVDEVAQDFGVVYFFGGNSREGGEQELKFDGSEALRMAVRNDDPLHNFTGGDSDVPFVMRPELEDVVACDQTTLITPQAGDVLCYLKNGGGDSDIATFRVFYTVGDDG